MAVNPYTQQTASGYNSSPPSDDGTVSEANRAKYATVKTKLADPVKVLADNIDDAASAAFAKTINTDADESNAIAGSLAFTSSELTVATGAVTVTRTHHSIDTESDAASDDLDTITATSVNTDTILILKAADATRTVVVKDGTGNIKLAGNVDYSMDDDEKRLVLMYDGTSWVELARSSVGLLATQAEMEAGTDTTVSVTPGRQHFHPSAAKGWAEFDNAGVETGTYNVSSVADTGSGKWTVNWDTDFSAATYCCVSSILSSSDTIAFPQLQTRGVGSVIVKSIDNTGSATESNVTGANVVAFGDHA